MELILDCGHEPSPHSKHTTGTVHVGETGEVCWNCGFVHEHQYMRGADKFTAYLSENGEAITTWPGQALARVTYLNQGRHNIGGSLYRFNAIDHDGARWYGTSPGKGMYARLRRAKP